MSDKQEGAADVAMGWGILGIIFLAVAFLIWWFMSAEISNFIRWIRYAEIWLVSQFVSEDYTVTWNDFEINIHQWRDGVATIPAEEISVGLLITMTAAALLPVKWFIVVIIVAIGIWTYLRGPGTHYRTRYDLDGLIKHQAGAFPATAPFVKFDPSNQPPRPPGAPVPVELPIFAEALGPEEWLAYTQNPMPDGKVDESAAFKEFARQLGPRWKGAKKLEPYKQVLLAAACLKASRRRNDSDDMLGRLALCWSHDKGLQLSKDKNLVKVARKVLRTKDLAAKTLSKCNQHAWETTALMRALVTAREEGGVLAPAQFVWLRGHNRNLWYPLNNLGRHTYHMEALGAMAHYKAEKMARRPIPKAKVEDAVQTISEYMQETRARPIPQLDYSGSQKRGIKKLKTT